MTKTWQHLGAIDLAQLRELVAKRYSAANWDMATRYAFRDGLITSQQYEWLREDDGPSKAHRNC